MKLPLNFCLALGFVLALAPLGVHADEGTPAPAPATPAPEEKNHTEISQELSMEYSYTGKSTLKQGSLDIGKMDSQEGALKYVLAYGIGDGTFLRFGVDWQRFDFGKPSNQPIPASLQSVAPVIGADIELSDNWIMRIEAEPGIYSDFKDISEDDINIPTVIGASYLVDKDLQWFFGISINPRSSTLPVVPGAGVRWKFADQWTLMFLLPKPRIQYEINDDITLFAGASIKYGNFQLSKHFGSEVGRTDLDNDNMEYREIRAGLGATWKFQPTMNLEVESGWNIQRRFESSQSDISFHSNGAPYGQIGISASF